MRGGQGDGQFQILSAHVDFSGTVGQRLEVGAEPDARMRGAHMTFGSKGIRRRLYPGTGIYYTSHSGYHSGAHSAHVEQPISIRSRRPRTGSRS